MENGRVGSSLRGTTLNLDLYAGLFLYNRKEFCCCSVAVWAGQAPSTPEQLVLPAGTGLHRHVGVHLQNHIPVLIQEKDPKRAHLVGNAARLWDARDDAHGPDDALDGGVVGWADHLQGGRERGHLRALPTLQSSPPTMLPHVLD